MFEKFLNIFRIPDLRKRVLFTLGVLAIYRLGSQLPTPGVNSKLLDQFFHTQGGSALGLLDMFSGGNLRRFTIFALGIMPYITASIIFQLLTVVYEPLARLQKEGELGRRKITQWTRYLTVILAAFQSIAIAFGLNSQGMVIISGPAFILLTVLTLTTGTAFIMWLGEQITDRGIGNGMSLLIFTGIVVGLPRGIAGIAEKVRTNAWGAFTGARFFCWRHGRAGSLHRLRRALRAADSGAIGAAHCWPPPDGRFQLASASQGQLGRRDAGHLCGSILSAPLLLGQSVSCNRTSFCRT
jgi:preprotein translocase subunit SecY